MTDQLHLLLEVQAHDTRLDQLHHELEALPARADRDAAVSALAALDGEIAERGRTRDELVREQRRLDDEIELLSTKRKDVEAKLYGGTVTNPRELQDLQEESGSLQRRIGQLEEQDLEVMEQLEPVDAALAQLAAAEEQGRTALDDAEQRLTVAEAELAAQVEAETAAREDVAARVDDQLLAEYRSLRGGRGGVGVSKLAGNQCGACHLSLSAVEVARMRKLGAGEVAHCEECGRILVP